MRFWKKYIRKSRAEVFRPIALNESNVLTIFSRCFTARASAENITPHLCAEKLGLYKETLRVVFDRHKIETQLYAIAYLYGQLQSEHEGNRLPTADDLRRSYTGETWTEKPGILMKLLYLGEAAGIISSRAGGSGLQSLPVLPVTLSPHDPTFSAWWAEQREAFEKSEAFVYILGNWYRGKDDPQALRWYKTAAEQGSVTAQMQCGMMYDRGEGTQADQDTALQWYERAAERGNAIAQYSCGEHYYRGEGTARNAETALRWYEKAAEQGDADAQVRCAVMYARGEGAPASLAMARHWYEKAAEQDSTCVKELYPLLAQRAEQVTLTYYAGHAAYAKKELETALALFADAARGGHPKAQYNCALMYSKGEGTQADKTAALQWYERAAGQGHAAAMFNCGVCYYNGDGAACDTGKAKVFFQKVAAQTEDKKLQAKASSILEGHF